MNSYFNTDFKTGIDWSTIGDYSGAFDNINSGAFGKPNSGSYSSSGQEKWKDALSKGIGWLSGTGKNKYRSQAERQQGGVIFMPRSGGGGGFQQIAPDISVFMPQQDQPFTVAGGQSSGGGIGSTIGGALGTVGGAFLGGPFGASVGGSVGSSIGGLFG